MLVITESVIFSAKPCKNVLNGRKSAYNQMFRICRERERPLDCLFFIFLSSYLKLFYTFILHQPHSISQPQNILRFRQYAVLDRWFLKLNIYIAAGRAFAAVAGGVNIG